MNLIPKRKYSGIPAVQESTIQETIARIGSLTVDSLEASKITAGNLAADVIATCSINANQITTGTLAANVSVTIGSGTSSIGTALSGARLELTALGIKGYDATTQRVQILNDGSGWFGSSSDFSWTSLGVISINGLRLQNTSVADAAIGSCSFGKLTAGTITVAATLGTGSAIQSAASGTRITITPTEIAGYNGSTKQFYLQSSDGKAYCGAGAAILDVYGVGITGNATAAGAMLRFADTAAHLIDSNYMCYIYQNNGSLVIGTDSSAGGVTIGALNGTVTLSAPSAYIDMSSSPYMKLPQKSSAPASGESEAYYNTTSHKAQYYNGTSWIEMGVGSGMADPLTERGSLIFRNATVPAELLHGTDGQVLTTKGHNADPIWTTPTGGGHTFATPAVTLGLNAGNGSAETIIRSDATIAAFDNNYPSTQAFGDSAVIGTVSYAARRDHKHAMPVASAAHGFTKSAELGAGNTRVLDVAYGGQAYAMIITVTVSASQAGAQMLIFSDASNPPTTNIYTSPACSAYEPMGFTFVVPKYHYYKVAINSTGSEYVNTWYEYQITT